MCATQSSAIGNLVFWRVAIKPGRPVALGVIPAASGHSAAFVGLPGNPVAVFVTFVRVVKPLLRRLSGARPDQLVPLPVRAAFAYRKKKDRREYVRVALRRAADGEIEAVKHPQDGAGILTSLTETDGLLEFPGGRDDNRARSPRRLPVLRGADRLNAGSQAPRRTPLVVKALSTGSWMLLSTTPPITAITMAATQAMMKLFIGLAPLPARRVRLGQI